MEDQFNKNRHQRVIFVAHFFANWHRYKKLLHAYWWILLAALMTSLGIQWLLLWRLSPSFVSTGQMIVNVKLSIPSANTYSEELENFFGTQVSLMQSDSVTNRVNRRLQSTRPKLQSARVRIQVSLAPKTSIFNLRGIGDDPHYTQAYLETTMEEYINLKKDLLSNASSVAKSNIQDELAQLAVKLDNSKQDYLNFQSSNSIVFLQENGGNSAAAYLSTLSMKLADRQSELQLLNSLTLDENLEHQQGNFMSPSSASSSIPPDNHLSDSNSVPASSILNLDAVTGNAAPTGTSLSALDGFEAAYLQAKQRVMLLKAQRDEAIKLAPQAFEVAGLEKDIAIQENLLQLLLEQRQEQLNNRKHTLEVQIQDLEDQIKEWEAKALEASKKLAIFQELKENRQQLQSMYDQSRANLQPLEVDKGTSQESVTILEPATSSVPLPRKTPQHMIIAGLIGLIVGFGILMFLDRLDDRPASFYELENFFHQPVLGQFPLVKAIDKRVGVPLLQIEDRRHMLVEAFQNLRSAMIYQDTPANHPRSIVITSASAHDGKSMVSANFAITLAQSGSRVLLVDADLRRGIMHKQFAVPAEPGLADVLAQRCDWCSAVVPTSTPNLFLLPAGACPRRPGSLFAMNTSKFLSDIAGHYDYYLFDTAPVMAADDVSSLAPHVDGLIMVIRAGVTSGRIAQAALDLLELRKVNVIGLVFNAVQTSGGEYHYYQDKNYYPQQTTT